MLVGITSCVALGLVIGDISGLLGLAGGEVIMPLILGFGAPQNPVVTWFKGLSMPLPERLR